MKSKLISIISGIIAGCLCGVLAISLINFSDINNQNSQITIKATLKNESQKNNQSTSSNDNIPVVANLNSSTTTEDTDISDDNSVNELSSSDDNSSSSKSTDKDDSSITDGSKIGTTKQSGEKIVYLTFDDGPSKVTPKILNILDKYDVKATFFVTGFDLKSANYIKIAHDKGHTIGLHTYTHDYSQVYSSVKAYYNDLDKIGQLCKEQLGYVPHYIRFPGGSSNTVSRKYTNGIMSFLSKDVLKKGYQYYDWNSANGDAEGGKQSAQQLYNNAIQYIGGTDLVMLCHDAGDKEATVQSLPKIIEYYKSKGYTFKAIDDTTFVAHHSTNN